MDKVVNHTGFIPFVKKFYRELIFTITFLILTNSLFSILQKNLHCLDKNQCQFWAGSWGFTIINISLGWIICYYILGITNKWKLSGLLKLLSPVAIIFYCLGIYYFFGNYILINQNIYISRNNSFESESKYSVDDFKYIYKSGSSGDGFDYYSIRLKSGGEVGIIDDSVINYLNNKLGI